jgi:hypothetical protein
VVSAFFRSFPQGAQSQTTSLQLHGVRSKAGEVKARGFSLPQKTGRESGEDGGDGEPPDDEVRSFVVAICSGRGALWQVRHILRWRARRAGAGGGFIVQFYSLSAPLLPLKQDVIPGTRLLRSAGIHQPCLERTFQSCRLLSGARIGNRQVVREIALAAVNRCRNVRSSNAACA